MIKTEDPIDGVMGEPLTLSDLGRGNIEGKVQEASASGSVSRDTVSELFPKRTVTPELLHVRDQQASPAALQNAPRLSEVMNAQEAQDRGDGRAPGQHDPPTLGRLFDPRGSSSARLTRSSARRVRQP
ncbi:MAG: hypothetical protein NXH97_04300 [Rhodobacteraceae bacterium]|nr:hypothetical protein [Paracoccaceae bacterium]